MSAPDDQDLVRLAQAIADGTAVDWDAEARRRPDLVPDFETLRLVGAVVHAHREQAGPHEARRPIGSWGPFALLERLGQGTFGEVFRAWDPTLERDVALKLFAAGDGDAGAVERARREERILDEARRLARVRHPNVLVVHGAARHDARIGIWADLVEGETLEQLLARQGPFGAREAVNVGLELCRALAAVHAADLVHRDVKAANVMRERGGRIVLMDFGAMSAIAPPGGTVARPGFGSPLATAPEQLRGDAIGPAADLYGLGVLLYRLLTGRYPVEAGSLEELRARHDRAERAPLRDHRPDLPVTLVRVVERALALRPEDRFASAGAMEQALDVALDPAGTPVATPTAPGGSAHGKHLAWTAVVAGLALAVVFVLARNAGKPVSNPPSAPTSSDRPPAAEPSVPNDPARTAVTPSPAPQPIVASARLFRQGPAGDERLLPGARIAPGDELFLELETREPLHVYVLDEDARGEVYVLFPSPQFDATNPLPPDRRRRLPGSRKGKAMNWQVTSAGGTETVLVIAAREALAELERDIAAFPRTSDSYGQLSGEGIRRLRGIGGMAEANEARPAGGRLSAIAHDVAGGPAAAGPWLWQIELAGAAP